MADNSPDLFQSLAALARAGCSVRIDPLMSPYGVAWVRVVVTPRASAMMRAVSGEVAAVASGLQPARPLVGLVPLVDADVLLSFLRDALEFAELGAGTSADARSGV